MSRAPRTTPPVEPSAPMPAAALLQGPFSPRAMVEVLFSKAGPQLASADLQRIIDGGAKLGENAAGAAARVAEGLGCLVAADGDDGSARVGSFQDGRGVADLLFHMQAHFEALEAMAAAVGWAASELTARGDK